jgi:hypothetical protein
MRTSEAFPDDSWLETQFTCFDEDKPDRESDSRWHTYCQLTSWNEKIEFLVSLNINSETNGRSIISL